MKFQVSWHDPVMKIEPARSVGFFRSIDWTRDLHEKPERENCMALWMQNTQPYLSWSFALTAAPNRRWFINSELRSWNWINFWQLKVNNNSEISQKNTFKNCLWLFLLSSSPDWVIDIGPGVAHNECLLLLFSKSCKMKRHRRTDFFFRVFFFSLSFARVYLHFHYLHESINSLHGEGITQLALCSKHNWKFANYAIHSAPS